MNNAGQGEVATNVSMSMRNAQEEQEQLETLSRTVLLLPYRFCKVDENVEREKYGVQLGRIKTISLNSKHHKSARKKSKVLLLK